jgi:hypothetical protein
VPTIHRIKVLRGWLCDGCVWFGWAITPHR